MSDPGADFGLVGPAYEAPMVLQDIQTCINWYLEVSGSKTSKEPMALLGCPGLNPLLSLAATVNTVVYGEVRGAWVLPGNTSALFVVGPAVYLVTVTGAATQYNSAQFSSSQIGTLGTTTGTVCIRDNGVYTSGAGGFAFLADGVNLYYYTIGSVGRSIGFTASVTSGVSVITLPGPVPQGILISKTAVFSNDFPANTFIITIDYSSLTIQASANATVTNGAAALLFLIPQFGVFSDPGIPIAPNGPSRVAFIEGWLGLNSDNTRIFQSSGPIPYTAMFPGSFFALKDSSSDNLVTMEENNRELWLIGEKTSEVWFDAGGANFAFQRIPGVGPQIGCSAKHSITRLGSALVWLGKNEQGENIVVMTNQYTWVEITNHAIAHAIASYPVVSDAIGFAYEEDGHLFYVLTFPTADVTWVYDHTASRKYQDPVWHRRASYDPVLGLWHRHRANCFLNFADTRMVGDYATGQIHQLSRSVYTDAGTVLKCQRRAPHVWSREDRNRVFQSRLQVEFTPGVGLQTGQGSDPQCMLRWSNDGGFTWSNEHWSSIGKAGKTRTRAAWNRLGEARDRVYEVNFTDPVPRDIIGATLFGEGEG